MNRGDINRKNAQKILKWCFEKYGKSKFNSNKTLYIIFDFTKKCYGEYDEKQNIIYINPNQHNSFIEFVDTIIHEFTHFLQDIKYQYYKYKKYDTNPYEKAAYKRAERDRWKCKRELFNKNKKPR